MCNEDDLALSTLLEVRAEIAPGLDRDLLEKAYAIQRKYQFSDDYALSAAALERLIDGAVDAEQAKGDAS